MARRARPPGVAALDVRSLTPLAGGASARLQLRRGEIVGLVGESGSGKSTAMNTLGCLDVPTTLTLDADGAADADADGESNTVSHPHRQPGADPDADNFQG